MKLLMLFSLFFSGSICPNRTFNITNNYSVDLLCDFDYVYVTQ